MEYRQRNSFYPVKTITDLSKHAKENANDTYALQIISEANDFIKENDKKNKKSVDNKKFDCRITSIYALVERLNVSLSDVSDKANVQLSSLSV